MSQQLSDVQMQNLLSSMTDAILAGNHELDSVVAQYEVKSADFDQFRTLIDNMDRAFIPVQPSQKFLRRLRDDLTGMDNSGMFIRVRRLPPRVQIAAGIALVAGFVFLSRRHMGNNSDPVHEAEAAIAR